MHQFAMRSALGVSAVCALLASAPTAAAAPALTLNQNTGLAAGQQVTVTLDGLDAGMAGVAVGQCKPQVITPADCNLPGALMGAADAQGVWQPSSGNRAVTLVAKVGGTDCTAAPGACTISVTSLTNPSQILASAPLTFAAPAPATTAAAPATTAAQPVDDDDDNSTPMILGIAAVVVVVVVAAALLLRRRRSGR
ncbi:neocarzinostatin apoprotein domain-containing protein [Nocardia sp. NPDC048505]|uniref:neocarzinostatin apoprotein domain-containing protein n=1 Tax=unclassified Nocardia TaxID=2637762 RepID=UPI0033D83C3A